MKVECPICASEVTVDVEEQKRDPNLPNNTFAFYQEGREIIRITEDADIIWFGKVTEAARCFWEAVLEMNPLKAQIDTYRNEINELKDRIRNMGLEP